MPEITIVYANERIKLNKGNKGTSYWGWNKNIGKFFKLRSEKPDAHNFLLSLLSSQDKKIWCYTPEFLEYREINPPIDNYKHLYVYRYVDNCENLGKFLKCGKYNLDTKKKVLHNAITSLAGFALEFAWERGFVYYDIAPPNFPNLFVDLNSWKVLVFDIDGMKNYTRIGKLDKFYQELTRDGSPPSDYFYKELKKKGYSELKWFSPAMLFEIAILFSILRHHKFDQEVLKWNGYYISCSASLFQDWLDNKSFKRSYEGVRVDKKSTDAFRNIFAEFMKGLEYARQNGKFHPDLFFLLGDLANGKYVLNLSLESTPKKPQNKRLTPTSQPQPSPSSRPQPHKRTRFSKIISAIFLVSFVLCVITVLPRLFCSREETGTKQPYKPEIKYKYRFLVNTKDKPLNIRQSPGGKVIGSASKMDTLYADTLIITNYNGVQWIRITTSDNTTGYVAYQYLVDLDNHFQTEKGKGGRRKGGGGKVSKTNKPKSKEPSTLPNEEPKIKDTSLEP